MENKKNEARYKLLYIWKKDSSRSASEEFHFNRKYHFSYDVESSKLSVTGPDPSFIDDFYMDDNETETDSSKSSQLKQDRKTVIDFSAIVGNNAVGKTTLLNFIHKYASNTGKIIEAEHDAGNKELSGRYPLQYIMVYLDLASKDKPLYVIPYNVYNVKVIGNNDKITVTNKLPGSFPQTVYLTNTFNFSDYVKALHSGDSYNLSTGYLMFSLSAPRQEEFTADPIIRYEHQEICRQSAVIKAVNEDSKIRGGFNEIRFNIPKNLVFFLKEHDWDGNDFPGIDLDLEKPEDVDKLKEQISSLKDNLNRCANHSYSDLNYPNNHNANLTINLCFVLIRSLIVSVSKAEPSAVKKLLEFSNDYWENVSSNNIDIEKAVNNVEDYFSDIKEIFNDKKAVSTVIVNHTKFLNSFIGWIAQSSEPHENYPPLIKIRTFNYISKTDFDELGLEEKDYYGKNDLFDVTLNGVSIETFMKEYEKISRYFASFSFSWEGLSSGESAFLSFFGRLFSIREKTKDCENLILLLDEADMLFHPGWQRNYINILHMMLPVIFPEKNIQVILATHSPLMLSDIPKQNTLFLKKDEDPERSKVIDGDETFAANIFSLFKNAFFLDESGMGEYSFNKIKRIIEQIHTAGSNKNDILKYIETVGDPYIKDKLLREYHSKCNGSEKLELLKAEKARLEAKIAELEKGN